MPVLEINNLTKIFRKGFWGRKVTVVENLSLEIEANEIFGFLGPNGAGKTTTIKLILNLIFPTAGNIRIFGEKSDELSVRRRIGFLPENPYFYDYLKAGEFLLFYAKLLEMENRAAKTKAREVLELVGLKNEWNNQLRRFSKGMIQRIGLAQSLLNDPDLIILDEPLSGLDPVGRKEFREIILNLKERSKTVFFSSHILPDVEMVCDRVGIIINGRLVKTGEVGQMLGEATKSVDITAQFPSKPPDIKGADRIIARGTQVFITTAGDPQPVIRQIMDAGGKVVSVSPHRKNLEELFMAEMELEEKGS